MRKKEKNKKIAVAMSGGIDSSVAAALLSFFSNIYSFEVVGIFMRNKYFSEKAEERARKVAKVLDIPFYVLNLEKEFKKRIISRFLKESKKGLTPNPCVICNKEIKFGLILEKAFKIGADCLATGHYAQIKNNRLLMAKDKEKDQSYFLWQLGPKQLKRVFFPLAGYKRKEVEKLAKKFKLPFKGIKKSQEICFVSGTTESFLKRRLKTKVGKIIDIKGKVLGQHQGLWFYTIGQRKGIKLPGGPYFVLDKDLKNNFLIVTKNEKDLLRKALTAKNINWISGKEPKFPLKVSAKIRYRSQAINATVRKTRNAKYEIVFNKPQRAVTAGQSVVFYKNRELLGGGIIC